MLRFCAEWPQMLNVRKQQLTCCEKNHVAFLCCLHDSSSTASLGGVAAVYPSVLPKLQSHHEAPPSDVNNGIFLAQFQKTLQRHMAVQITWLCIKLGHAGF